MQPPFITNPIVGQKISPDLFDKIMRELRRVKPIAGNNVSVNETPAGTVVSVATPILYRGDNTQISDDDVFPYKVELYTHTNGSKSFIIFLPTDYCGASVCSAYIDGMNNNGSIGLPFYKFGNDEMVALNEDGWTDLGNLGLSLTAVGEENVVLYGVAWLKKTQGNDTSETTPDFGCCLCLSNNLESVLAKLPESVVKDESTGDEDDTTASTFHRAAFPIASIYLKTIRTANSKYQHEVLVVNYAKSEMLCAFSVNNQTADNGDEKEIVSQYHAFDIVTTLNNITDTSSVG